MRKVSKKRRAMEADRKATREAVLDRDQNACQANIVGCTLHATDVHEIKSRARGGNFISTGDLSNFLSLCRSCHSFITTNPAFGERHGFLVPSWAGPAEYRAATRARTVFVYGLEQNFEVSDEEAD